MASLAAARAAESAAATALAAERARIQELEAGLARLRGDSQAQQKTLGALQARLRQADGDRYANGLVYTLAAAMLFFVLLVGRLLGLAAAPAPARALVRRAGQPAAARRGARPPRHAACGRRRWPTQSPVR